MEDINQFDKLSDDLLRLIFNRVIDANSLHACLSVSKRFSTVAPEINTVAVQIPRRRKNIVNLPAVIETEEEMKKKVSLSLFEKLMRFLIVFFVVRPIMFMYRSFARNSPATSSFSDDTYDESENTVAIQAIDEQMKRFNAIETIEIRLPGPRGEAGFNGSSSLLKWKAEFDTELKNCAIICATSVEESNQAESVPENDDDVDFTAKTLYEYSASAEDVGQESISLGSDELMARIMLTISTAVAASTRHFSLKQMVKNRPTLRGVTVSDEKKRGVLCMNEEQINEMRNCLNSEEELDALALDVNRTRVPALNVNMCYLPVLELPKTGKVMLGATLILIGHVDSVKSVKSGVDLDRDFFRGVFNGDTDEHLLTEAVNIMMNTMAKKKFTMEIDSF